MSERTLEDRIQDFLDGRMGEDELAAFRGALQRDPELAARVAEYRGIGDALREPVDPLSSDFYVRTRARFEGQSRSHVSPRWFRILSWESAGLAAAAGLAAVLFVPSLWQEGAPPYESPPRERERFAQTAPRPATDPDDALAESEIDELRPETADPRILEKSEELSGEEGAKTLVQPRRSEKKSVRAELPPEESFKDDAPAAATPLRTAAASVAETEFPVRALPEGAVLRGEVRVIPGDDAGKRKSRDQQGAVGYSLNQAQLSWVEVLIGAGPGRLDCATLVVTRSATGWLIRVEESESGAAGCGVRLPAEGGPVEVERIAVE